MDFDHRAQRAPTTDAAATDGAMMPGSQTLTESLVVQRRELAAAPEAQFAVSGTAASAPALLPVSASSSPRPTLQMLFGVQRAEAAAPAEDSAQVHAAAARGTATPASKLPYADQIQRAFGQHDISGIHAHVGSDAAASAREMGAQAYATGNHVVLGEGADLHTVAHETAHVVQQRAGVSLKGGVGKAGDAYEQHADRVADLVVAGQSAESALNKTDTSGSAGGQRHETTHTIQQRSGNAVQRQQAPDAGAPQAATPPARTAAQLDALKEDIVQAIAEKETHRQAIESRMQTSAGPRASYASQLQATTGWTITALLRLDATRLATFNLTRAELLSAQARASAAGSVWSAVMATPASMTAAAWSTAHAALLGSSGLTAADMTNMFLFRDLRTAVLAALPANVTTRQAALVAMAPADVWALATAAERRRVGAPTVNKMNNARRAALAPLIARRETIATLAATPAATALGIGASTISAYRPAGGGNNFGEDSAAWQRVAAGREPPGGTGTVGQRIEDAATRDGGLALGRARIGQIVDAFLAANPAATDEQVVRDAARRHNPGNPMADVVFGHFTTFHAARSAAPAAPTTPPAPAPAPGPAAPAPAQSTSGTPAPVPTAAPPPAAAPAPPSAAPAPAQPGPGTPSPNPVPSSDTGGGAHSDLDVPPPAPGPYPAIPPQSEDEMLGELTDPGDDPAGGTATA